MSSFSKAERLCKQAHLQLVHQNGASFYSFPYRFIWVVNPDVSPFPVQVLIAVSKKKFKRAVDRNRIKRLTREAYRKHKHLLYQNEWIASHPILLAIHYNHQEILSYTKIEQAICNGLEQLLQSVTEKQS